MVCRRTRRFTAFEKPQTEARLHFTEEEGMYFDGVELVGEAWKLRNK